MKSLKFTDFETFVAQNPRSEIGITVPHGATLENTFHESLEIRSLLDKAGIDFQPLNQASRIDADFGALCLAKSLSEISKEVGITVHIISSKISRVIADVGRLEIQPGVDTVFTDPDHPIKELHSAALKEVLDCVGDIKDEVKMILDLHTMADYPRQENVQMNAQTINDGSYVASWLNPDRSKKRNVNFVHKISHGKPNEADFMMHYFQQVLSQAGIDSVPNEHYAWDQYPYTAHRTKALVPAFNMIDFPKGLLSKDDPSALANLTLDRESVMGLAQVLVVGIERIIGAQKYP